ncbi:hypothetical protein MMC20_006472 [Loxospora ochrophaea]|nr:hypothetical protein [Loxospora ochrophaea]
MGSLTPISHLLGKPFAAEDVTGSDTTISLEPFPEDLPTIELPKISLSKLLDRDDAEAQQLFDICTRTGFFYLDLTDHDVGRKFWNDAVEIRQKAGKTMQGLEMSQKDAYLKRPVVGILDRGFQSTVRDEHGETKFNESFNIPRDELFGSEKTDFQLPSWLEEYKDLFKSVMRNGNLISNTILDILERGLQLKEGTFKDCHKLEDQSHSFLRILRYPGLKAGADLKGRFFAHRDLVSIAILITWLGGLQIPMEDPEIDQDTGKVTEDSWRWVKPLAGMGIVNLGDAMTIFTNNKLKSGLHRVLTAPGEQARSDRISVLVSSRPANQTLMKAFQSPLIPEGSEKAEVVTCKVWGDKCVEDFINNEVKKVKGTA